MAGSDYLFYRNLKYQSLFDRMSILLGVKKPPELPPDPFDTAGQLAGLAQSYGFQGNVWHCFLTLVMIEHENPFSLFCENKKEAAGDLFELAEWDFTQIKQLFDQDISRLDRLYQMGSIWSTLAAYHSDPKGRYQLSDFIRYQLIFLSQKLEQAESSRDFQQKVAKFYQQYGVGVLGMTPAFRIEGDSDAHLVPVRNVEQVSWEDLVGYELQKAKLIANTESFLQGRAANNVLLYGDAGTGKSSSIKALLNEYYGSGLRIIEIYKHQFRVLNTILEQLKDRNYKFIIYMDDLSFEDHELEYKYLKAIMEGGLTGRPDHVLIYATSNRRHLIREKFSDKKQLDDELHGNDTVQEKLSLAARFGVTIYYGAPDKKEYEEIVKTLAKQCKIEMDLETLLLEAGQWELSHGGRSGRAAAQFITYLMGRNSQK